MGDIMNMNSKDLLNSIVKTSQMGQIGIRSVLNSSVQQDLRTELQAQLDGYDHMEREAIEIAASKGWKVDELNPMIKTMTNLMTKTRLRFGNTDSKAAAMMIRGNMKGIIKGNKNLNHCKCSDERISRLQAKLIRHEEQYTKQMQGFL